MREGFEQNEVKSKHTCIAILPLPINLLAELLVIGGREVRLLFLWGGDGHTGGVVRHIGIT